MSDFTDMLDRMRTAISNLIGKPPTPPIQDVRHLLENVQTMKLVEPLEWIEVTFIVSSTEAEQRKALKEEMIEALKEPTDE